MNTASLSDALFTRHPDPMWIYDVATLRFMEVNEAAIARYGYSRQEFLSMSIADIRPAEDVAALADTVRKVGQSLNEPAVWRHRLKDGRLVDVEITSQSIELDGTAARLVVARDVSGELRTQAELAEANRLLRIANHTARLGGWRVDVVSREVTWTGETAAIYELPEGSEPTLREAIDFYAPEDRPRIEAAFEACARDGEPFDEVLRLVTARGNQIRVRAIGEPERGHDGAIRAVAGALQDVTELMDARERSVVLAKRLHDTLEHISDAFFTLDSDWRFSFLNRRAEELLERRRADLVDRNVWESFPEARATIFQREYEKTMWQGRTARFVQYYPPLERWFQVTAYPASDGIAVYFRDVTEERAREAQMRLLETAVSRLNDIVIITEVHQPGDLAGRRIIYVNDAFERHTGFRREEAVGQPVRMLHGPATSRGEVERIETELGARRGARAELVHYRKSGEEMPVELEIVPILDHEGNFTHLVSVERDISERYRAERAARESQERFELVARATNDVIWDWDVEAGTVWWNDNLGTVFGHDRQDVEPGFESWSNRVHPDDRDRLLAGLRELIDGEDRHWRDEYRFRRGNGTWAVVVDRGFAIRDEGGRVVRMIGSMLDVTEQRELDERLRQSQKLEAVGQLTGSVAHDFNNLLTVIMGNSELLSRRLDGDGGLRALAEMTGTAAQRGAELTHRLLAFARRQPLEPKLVDMGKLASGMDGLLRRTLSEDIDIEIVRGGGLWIVEVDPGQLEVALLNLAINARDAMPGGGQLTIETANVWLNDAYVEDNPGASPGQHVLVSVSDTGSGMTREVMEQAFEPFFTTKDVGKGSGLGLSMVYGFVKQSGGHIKIYSEVGQGSSIKLYFPRSFAEDVEMAGTVEEIRPAGGSERILVVEDDELVREHVITQLEGLGYCVTSAGNGPDALEALRQLEDIDLLFTDIIMPAGIDGAELAKQARRLRPGLKVLFTSGYTENAIVHSGRLDRGVQLLSKPYRLRELASKVRSVLDAPVNEGRDSTR